MVYSIAGSLPAAVPRREPVHYHSYLTPLLHRRFARSCAITIIACYVESFLIGNKSNIFWACFPLSWTGVRCLCLFLLGSFPVLILRISQLHLDTRAYASAFHGVRRLLGSFSTYTAVCVYVISSMTVTLSYLYSSGDDAQLHMITEARSYERPRLNERFLYILFLALYTGMIQGINHIREDKGRVVLSSSSLSPQEAIKLHYLDALKHMSSSTMVACLSGPIVYLPLRPLIWENALILARTFYWLNRSTVLPNFPIGPGLFFRSVLITFLTCGLVEVSHLAFASHFSYDHLSAGKCLIEKSSDPNGTLLTGLRSTKSPLTRTLAFRELRYIANSRPDRRRDIFIDVNRQPKNAWEQILQECLQTLREVESRLSELSPFRLAQSLDAPQQSPLTELDFPPPIPIGKANILVSTSNAKSHKFLDSLQSNLSENALRSRKQLPNSRNWINPEGTFLSQAKFRLVPYIASSYGKPFRQTIQLTASRILPNVGLQIDAVEALTYLVCASLTEDEYGVVHKDLSTILEHFNSSLHTLENFCNQPPLHWTDTDAKNAENSLHLEEPNHLIETLRSSKNKILQKFEPYKDTVLSPSIRDGSTTF